MNDNGNIRLLTPEKRHACESLFLVAGRLSKRVEKICDSNKPVTGRGTLLQRTRKLAGETEGRAAGAYRITRNNGILPYIQIGGRILYRASDIERTLMDGYKEAYHQNGRTRFNITPYYGHPPSSTLHF